MHANISIILKTEAVDSNLRFAAKVESKADNIRN